MRYWQRTGWKFSLLGVAALSLMACGDLGVTRSGGGSSSSAASSAPVAEPSPKVELTSPARGSFFAPGSILVEGRVFAVSASSPVTQARVMGQPVTLTADGRFHATVALQPGANIVTASCEDADGRAGSTAVGVLAGDFVPAGTPLAHAACLRMNDAAIDALGEILERVVWALDLRQLLVNAGPIYSQDIRVAQLRVDITQVQFFDVDVQLGADTQGLRARVEIRRLLLEALAQADLVFGGQIGPAQALVEVDSAVLQGHIRLDPRADGTVEPTFVAPDLQLHGFRSSSTTPLLRTLLPLLQTAVGRALESLVADLLQNQALTALDDALREGLQPTGFDVLGKLFAYDIRLEQAIYDADGFTVQASFDSEPVAPTARALTAPGSLVTPGNAPALVTSRGGVVAVDDDAINRAFYGAWAGGVLDFALDAQMLRDAGADPNALPLQAGLLLQFLPEIGAVVSEADPIQIRLEPWLPPTIEVTGNPDLAWVRAPEMHVRVMVDRGSGWEELLHAVAHMGLGAGLELTAAGLKISAARLPDLVVDVVEEPLVELDDRRIQIMLGLVLTPAIPDLINGVGLIAVPHLGQLSRFSVDMDAGGVDRDHLILEGDLVR